MVSVYDGCVWFLVKISILFSSLGHLERSSPFRGCGTRCVVEVISVWAKAGHMFFPSNIKCREYGGKFVIGFGINLRTQVNCFDGPCVWEKGAGNRKSQEQEFNSKNIV